MSCEEADTDIKQIIKKFNPLKPKNQTFNPYLKENTTRLHYKDWLINTVYSENHMKPINTMYGQNAELSDRSNSWYIQLPVGDTIKRTTEKEERTNTILKSKSHVSAKFTVWE
jgi:hypothetical protein